MMGAVLVSAAAAGQSVQLSRATANLVEVRRGDVGYSYEKGIAPAEAQAIFEHLQRSGLSGAVMVRVPGRRGIHLVAAVGRGDAGPKDQGGLCLILLEKAKEGFTELARTRGAGDSYSLKPVVFTGGGRTIVLAEMGTEYSWGLQVYEVSGRALRELGTIDAGVAGEDGEEDPTPFARVRIERGRVAITFDADLILGTGQDHAPIAKKPVVFRHDGNGIVHVPRR